MIVSVIAAAAQNRTIGFQGKIPWNLPSDLKYFRDQTKGKPIIMGRKTFASIGRPLPARQNIVISRQTGFTVPAGVYLVGSFEDALKAAGNAPEVWVIGGQAVYQAALDAGVVDRIYLTDVNVETDGDAFFPILAPTKWDMVKESEWMSDGDGQPRFRFLEFERVVKVEES